MQSKTIISLTRHLTSYENTTRAMNRIVLIICICIINTSKAQMVAQVTDPVEWVNTLMGTDSKHNLSNGNTYPAIAVPWGMIFRTPQTSLTGDGWQYQYSGRYDQGL